MLLCDCWSVRSTKQFSCLQLALRARGEYSIPEGGLELLYQILGYYSSFGITVWKTTLASESVCVYIYIVQQSRPYISLSFDKVEIDIEKHEWELSFRAKILSKGNITQKTASASNTLATCYIRCIHWNSIPEASKHAKK